MPGLLPTDLRPRPVAHESRAAAVCGANEKPRHGIHTIVKTFAPLNNPIERCRYAMRQRGFCVWVYVNEVDRAGASGGQTAKIVALGEEPIEGTECAGVWVITARNVGFRTKAGFQEGSGALRRQVVENAKPAWNVSTTSGLSPACGYGKSLPEQLHLTY